MFASPIIPSLPAQSWDEIETLAVALRGVAPVLQIDIVDGQFVTAVSWPFTESDPRVALSKLSTLTTDFSIQIDAMVQEPEQYLTDFVSIPLSGLIVHMGSTTAYDVCIAHARTHGYQIGLAMTNDVPVSDLLPLLAAVDFIQVMGIAVVGKQGQPFDERTLTTIHELRAHTALPIMIDGSVNQQTIVPLKAAGATVFAPGSAIAKQTDPQAAYITLKQLVAVEK